MRIGVVTFPGSLDDRDAARAVRIAGGRGRCPVARDADLHGVDAVVLPGRLLLRRLPALRGDRRFAPAMGAIIDAARGGLPVLGICNGFQILCESHLLPGALTRNAGLHFVCRDQELRSPTRTPRGPATTRRASASSSR
jgi:phosphoribosylformylglycinamidine synthase subunit PurQ / glutaminase